MELMAGEAVEAGPQLRLRALLQRSVNDGGRISREYGLGRRRTDLLLEWPLDEGLGYRGPMQRVVIALKILHRGLPTTLAKGLEQTFDYADRRNADEAHLVIFDRRDEIPREEKVWRTTESYSGRTIEAWGA